MTRVADGRPLFRPEAVEAHARGRTAHKPVDLREGRTQWAFRGLLALVLVAVVTGYSLHSDISTKGTGRVDGSGRTAALLLPAGALRRLHAGQPGWLDTAGGRVRGHVAAIAEPRAANGGVEVPVVLALDAPAPAGASGVAYVRLGHPTLAALLLGRHSG